MTDTANNHRNHAGPFGFTRAEVVVLAGIIGVSVVVITYASWHQSRHSEPAVWAIEDVLVHNPAATSSSDENDSTNDAVSPAHTSRSHSELIDLNAADIGALTRLPGIGGELARRIVAEREAHGNFVNLTDLQRVNGIGPRKAAMLSGWVTFSTPALPSPDQPPDDSLESP